MENKTTNILLGAILAVGLGVLIVSLQLEVNPQINVNPQVNVEPILGAENEFITGVTATSTLIGDGNSTQAIATNTARMYLRLQNVGNNRITCILNPSTTVTLGAGIMLNASNTVGSIYEIKPDNLYKGAIRCKSETATTSLSVVEK